MASEEDPSRQRALERIAEANALLAQLQRARFTTLTESCLPAYRMLRSGKPLALPFTIPSSLFALGSADFDPNSFADQSSAAELELAVESLSKQLRLLRKKVEGSFDTFLSYNSEDRGEVRTIAAYLQSAGLLPWFDQNELRPGQDWLTRLQEDIAHVRSCVVVIGSTGLGPWQRVEVNSAIQLFVNRHLPVVPVVLPGCTSDPQLPLFLHSVGWVDFRRLDPDPIAQLVRAICGDA